MKTQYYTAASLDGFIATEDDSVDWLHELADPEASTYAAFIGQVGALAMGAHTYEWVLRHGEEALAETGSRWPYSQPTWVFTHRELPRVEGAELHFAQGDVRAVHAEMAARAGGLNLWIVGGGALAAQFHDAGLLDEMIVQLGSVTLGRGKPLFPRRMGRAMKLLSAQALGAGMVELRYDLRTPAAPGADA